MFKLNKGNNKRKNKNLLLGLALKDRDWVVGASSTHSIDHVNKFISTPQLNNEDTTTFEYKLHKALAVISAKYGEKRRLVGASHLKQYLPMVMRMTVYWYLVKKTDEYFNKYRFSHNSKSNPLVYYVHSHKSNQQDLLTFIADYLSTNVVSGTVDVVFLANVIVNKEGALEYFSYQPNTKLNRITRIIEDTITRYNSNEYSDADAQAMVKIFKELLVILDTAYGMIMSVRKDSKVVSNNKVKQVAQYLHDNLSTMNVQINLPSVELNELELSQDGLDVLDDYDIRELNKNIKRNFESGYQDAVWGKMKILNPKLTERLPVQMLKSSKKKSDMGVNPKSMNRWTTDKKIFTNKTKRYGGTVLIDVSGSMSLVHDDIKELAETLPAGTVAMYSGLDNYDLEKYKYEMIDKITTGHITILASKGNFVGNIETKGKQNLIDGPAIKWLSQQEEPRILVTDMQVSGIGKNSNGYMEPVFNAELTIEALRLVSKNNITVIPDVEKATEWAKAYIKNS